MSFALVVGTSMPAFAATPLATISDVDKDGLSNKIEVKITRTDPLEADTDNDRIDDGDEDVDEDGVDNTDELWLGTKVTDDDSDHDSVEDGDEDKDRDGIDNEDEDDLRADADNCDGAEDDADQDSDGDDLDDESRAITWMPKGLELLDWLGLGDDFARLGVRRTAHEFWANGRRLLRMPFDEVRSPHRYTLQLPQHDSEALLEAAALGTGLVEIRRGHRVVEIGRGPDRANMGVEGPDESYRLEARWAVGCDGAGSGVRHMLGIETRWRDYGTDSAVADFEMDCDLPKEVSRIVLRPARPYGFFYFAPGR